MSRFSRSWTQHLKTDKQGFIVAFNKVVSKQGWSIRGVWEFLDYKIGEDCTGEVNNKSFTICRKVRDGYYYRIEGNITEDVNGLTLNIYQHGRANYFLIITRALLFACFLYIPVLNLLGEVSIDIPFVLLILFVYLPVYSLCFWLTDRFFQRKINKLHSYYKVVLAEIEKHAISDKKYSTK